MSKYANNFSENELNIKSATENIIASYKKYLKKAEVDKPAAASWAVTSSSMAEANMSDPQSSSSSSSSNAVESGDEGMLSSSSHTMCVRVVSVAVPPSPSVVMTICDSPVAPLIVTMEGLC
jgi:hypothetical protein